MTTVELTWEELRSEADRRREGITLAEEAERLSGSLRRFVRAAWPHIRPHDPYVHGWHIDAICDHLEAVSAGEIRKLQVWVPPGSMKSLNVSVIWPAWEWTLKPWLRYMAGSHTFSLATELSVTTRSLVESTWYRDRWSLRLRDDENTKTNYVTLEGGGRFVTSPGAKAGGTGKHADRILIDDPINAGAADATAQTVLDAANTWYDGTLSTRFANPKEGVEVIIMQRLHERDLAAHALEMNPDFTILCLPEEYAPRHPFLTPRTVTLPSGRELLGDQRSEDGELLWPERIGPDENRERKQRLTAHRAAAQLQQLPAPREGDILKRADWRFYNPKWSIHGDDREGVFGAKQVGSLPEFERIVHSWDTSLKDRERSDFAVGTVWGVKGANLYLVRIWRERAGLSRIVNEMIAMYDWSVDLWPDARTNVLVENAATGPEAVAEIRRRVQGVVAVVPRGSKEQRAEAAAPALEGHNVWVPGVASDDGSGYEAGTPTVVQALIEEAAAFPNAAHDDQVDSWSQAVNWLRRQGRPARARTGIPVGRA